MNPRIAVSLCVLGLAFAILTFELIRRRYLLARHALAWAAVSAAAFVLVIFPGAIGRLAQVTGMQYQSAVILLVFIFTALLLMGQTVISSRHSARITRLTQEIALLRSEVADLRRQCGMQKRSGD